MFEIEKNSENYKMKKKKKTLLLVRNGDKQTRINTATSEKGEEQNKH